MSFGRELVDLLCKNGFEKKVYYEQVGQPVFYTRVFQPSECPVFIHGLVEEYCQLQPCGLTPGRVIVEIAEDGTLLQCKCPSVEYWVGYDPETEVSYARNLLAKFEIRAF
jgi:hypothetical protein